VRAVVDTNILVSGLREPRGKPARVLSFVRWLPRGTAEPLTLRQFASLCAELSFKPEWRHAILARYEVRDETVLAALDAYWRKERAARPEARTAFADDFARHLAWLHAHWA
jgi:hypothetical protein